MESVITPELEKAIQELISQLLIEYGIYVVILIVIVSILSWHWIKRKLEGEVQKGVNEHKAEIDNAYIRQIENYHLYVAKQHEAYAELNKLLLKTEGMAAFQVLKNYLDFTELSKAEITEYLKEKNVIDKDLNRMIKLMDSPRELQSEMQAYTERFNVREARNHFNKTRNHYWLNALYFSDKVGSQFESIVKILSRIIIIREIPSNGGRMSKEDRKKLMDLQKELRKDIDKIIKQMKTELSAGLSK